MVSVCYRFKGQKGKNMEEQIQHMKESIADLTFVLADIVCWAAHNGMGTDLASELLERLYGWNRREGEQS